MRVKKRGVPKCSQRKNAIKKAPEKAPKSKKTPENRVFFGAATQIRTGDLILTKDALYLLSYSSKVYAP